MRILEWVFDRRKADEDEETRLLDKCCPDWQVIVGRVDIAKKWPDPTNPFRHWLAQQSPDYQTLINTTTDAVVVLGAIDRFKAKCAKQT
jgi:hypothetical protein